MTIKKRITIKDRKIEQKESDYGGTYLLLFLYDEDNKEYSTILGKDIVAPDIGDTVDIIYNEVTGKNRILKLENVQMATTKKITKTTTTDKFFKIKGTLFYAHIKEPNNKGKFPTHKYEVSISVSDTWKKALENLGVDVKNKNNELGNFVRCKSTYKPTVIDPEGNEMLEPPLIGNGSTAMITVSLYDNKAPQGGDKCLGFSKVELLDLVQYEAKLLIDE